MLHDANARPSALGDKATYDHYQQAGRNIAEVARAQGISQDEVTRRVERHLERLAQDTAADTASGPAHPATVAQAAANTTGKAAAQNARATSSAITTSPDGKTPPGPAAAKDTRPSAGKTTPGKPVTSAVLHDFCQKCGFTFSKPQPASACGSAAACGKRQKANAAGEPWPGVSGKAAKDTDPKKPYPYRHPKFTLPGKPPAKPRPPRKTAAAKTTATA